MKQRELQYRRTDPVFPRLELNMWYWIDLFYYTVFRVECFLQFVLTYPFLGSPELVTIGEMDHRPKRVDKRARTLRMLNNPKEGITLIFTVMHATRILLLFLLALWNFVFTLSGLNFYEHWYSGFWITIGLAIVTGVFTGPLGRKRQLKAFKAFSSRSPSQKRNDVIVVLAIEASVWIIIGLSIVSFRRS